MEIIALIPRDFEAALHERSKSDSPYEARVAHMLGGLLDVLRRDAIGPRLFASYHLQREIFLQYFAPNGSHCMITVAIDSPDYGPLENGLPRFHYRMTYQLKRKIDDRRLPLIEERVHSVESASEIVRQAILEARKLP